MRQLLVVVRVAVRVAQPAHCPGAGHLQADHRDLDGEDVALAVGEVGAGMLQMALQQGFRKAGLGGASCLGALSLQWYVCERNQKLVK